jgi:hypothetical protein
LVVLPAPAGMEVVLEFLETLVHEQVAGVI